MLGMHPFKTIGSSLAVNVERKHVTARMSQSVVHGGVVYLAGQVAHEKNFAPASEQTREILARIDSLLAECGTDKTHILTAQVWLTDIRLYDEMNREWDAWVAPGNPPARACIEAKLAGAAGQYVVEIMVTAALP
jgi:enamine deaminase RidA (YjgF/YER057c/UK114 family)